MTMLMKAKEVAEQLYNEVQAKVEDLKLKGVQPQIATVLVEGDPASAYYAQAKQKIAKKLGVVFSLYSLPTDVTEEKVIQLIKQLNQDASVHGIMLELPLPGHLSTRKIENTILPMKDIDGVTASNKLATMTGDVGIYPATPQACIKLLKHYGIKLTGKNVTLIGRGQTVGLPLFHMLQRENATVTLCHSRTPDIASHLTHAEICFVAVGRANMVTSDMVHEKLAIIDAGINEIEGGKIVGDVSVDVYTKVEAISPVPGGVGTLTTAILYENLLKAIDIQMGRI